MGLLLPYLLWVTGHPFLQTDLCQGHQCLHLGELHVAVVQTVLVMVISIDLWLFINVNSESQLSVVPWCGLRKR